MKKEKNIILFTTRPITSKYTKSLMQQMSILKEYQDHGIIFVTPKSDLRNKKYIEEAAKIKIDKVVSYKDHYNEVVFKKKYKTWLDYLENVNLFEDIRENVTDIVVFGGLLSDATAITRKKNGLQKILKTWQQMNFTANGSYMTGFFQLVNLSRQRKIHFHEICYDPCENSIDQISFYKPYKYTCYHGYNWPEYNLKRLDSLQYYLNNVYEEPNPFFTDYSEKKFDVCFGFTAFTSERERQYDKVINSLDNVSNYKMFVRHKRLGIDTFVDRDQYLEKIRESRYTLIIPPYDEKHFSVYRFIESVFYDCLPFITSDVYVKDFMNSFGIEEEMINEIVIDYSEIGDRINDMSEKKRNKLLSYFKEKFLKETHKLNIEDHL